MNQKFYTTLEQSKRLKELGVVQQSDAFWENGKLENHHLYMHGAPINPVAAYSVGELGIMLQAAIPRWIAIWDEWGYQEVGGHKRGYGYEAEARAEKLLHLIENELLTVEEINALYLKAIA